MKESLLITKYNELISEFEKEIEGQTEITSGFLSLLWFFTLIILLVFLGEYFQLTGKDLSVFLLIGALIPWYFGRLIIYQYLSKILNYLPIRKIRRLFQYLTETFDLISEDISKIQTIEEILEKIDAILKLETTLQAIQKKINNNSNYRRRFGGLIAESMEWILQILTDLRSDLSICLIEKQQTLKSAKSEVEKNIVGSTELNQASELQRARLDRQIEQFEELQRVLVKI